MAPHLSLPRILLTAGGLFIFIFTIAVTFVSPVNEQLRLEPRPTNIFTERFL